MNKTNKIFTLGSLFIFFTNITTIDNHPTKFVQGEGGSGFFSTMRGVIGSLAWHDRTGLPLCIYWDKTNLYYQEGGYNESTNAFEYYFEPICPKYHYEPGEIINGLNPDELAILNFAHIDSRDVFYRLWVNSLIKKYLKIKKNIQEKIDHFYNTTMAGKENIGVHYRAGIGEANNPTLDEFLTKLELITNDHPNAQLLVASDEPRTIEAAKIMFKNRVISYDSIRLGAEMHSKILPHKAKMGEEVLIEAQLLSKCNLLVHTLSNVTSFVLFFNPHLSHIEIGTIDKIFWPYHHLTSAIQNRLPAQPTIVEVGAMFGHNVTWLSAIRPQARIIACEPNSSTYGELEKLKNDNISTYQIALSTTCGKQTFYNLGWLSSLNPPTEHMKKLYFKCDQFIPQIEWVNTITLDQLCENCKVNTIDLLWLDTGGSELELLKNFKKLSKVHLLYFSACNHQLWEKSCTFTELKNFLNAHGFIEAAESWMDVALWHGSRALFVNTLL